MWRRVVNRRVSTPNSSTPNSQAAIDFLIRLSGIWAFYIPFYIPNSSDRLANSELGVVELGVD
jgi:hypothetical protein